MSMDTVILIHDSAGGLCSREEHTHMKALVCGLHGESSWRFGKRPRLEGGDIPL